MNPFFLGVRWFVFKLEKRQNIMVVTERIMIMMINQCTYRYVVSSMYVHMSNFVEVRSSMGFDWFP